MILKTRPNMRALRFCKRVGTQESYLPRPYVTNTMSLQYTIISKTILIRDPQRPKRNNALCDTNPITTTMCAFPSNCNPHHCV